MIVSGNGQTDKVTYGQLKTNQDPSKYVSNAITILKPPVWVKKLLFAFLSYHIWQDQSHTKQNNSTKYYSIRLKLAETQAENSEMNIQRLNIRQGGFLLKTKKISLDLWYPWKYDSKQQDKY